MEATETQNRFRPSLQPLWTGYHDLHAPSRPSFRLRSPSFAPSPMSPRTLPSPLHPRASSAQESAMRKHERAMVDSLDQGAKASASPGTQRSLSPISEQRVGHSPGRTLAITSSPAMSSHAAGFSPLVPACGTGGASQAERRQTIVAETRNILLSGLPRPQARNVGASVDRRQSLPPISLPPPTPSSPSRRGSSAIREQLEAWGHIYFADAKYADCFVVAVSLRRTSDSPEAGAATPSSPSASPKDSSDRNQVTIRARVKPRAFERKPFLLQRTFNIDELRATVPEPSPVSASAEFRRPSRSIDELSWRTSRGIKSCSPTLGSDRRFSSFTAGQVPPKAALSPSLNRPLRGASAIPIHLKYARVHLPILAALMMSGHVREGDVIYLPLPHPEAWYQTVARVYTGQGELTDAIKENILYLAGRI